MFGSHLSIAGGLCNALLAAEQLALDTVQVFTANPRTFGTRPVASSADNAPHSRQRGLCTTLAKPAVREWKSHCGRLGFERTVSHDSYLINLASPDETLRQKSIALFTEEVARCAVLGVPLLVAHPGAHMGEGEAAGLKRVAESLDTVHAALPRLKVITCLEVTAGQGTSLGHRLEHLAEIISAVRSPERLGVCLDTAHLFAAGYDFRGRRYAGFRRELERTVGAARVRVLHLNDSKKDLGSRVDRHEHIGQGTIGATGFKPFVRDRDFKSVPKILETPKGKNDQGREWDAVNLEVLRGLM